METAKVDTISDIAVFYDCMHEAVSAIEARIQSGEGGYICVADGHSFVLTTRNAAHKTALTSASLVVPDGMPLVWMLRLRGQTAATRISGTELLHAILERSETTGWRHAFFGNRSQTLGTLKARLVARYPRLNIASMVSPPFRDIADILDAGDIEALKASRPNVIWVSLGCPKQERWMLETASALAPAILIGVGAAFDFVAGTQQRAPAWMQRAGLEWLHRSFASPRLMRRYLYVVPRLLLMLARESLASALWKRAPTTASPT